MNYKIYGFLLCLLLLVACSPSIQTRVSKTYTPLKATADIRVIELTEATPSGAEVIGTVSIGDNFTLKCNYDVVLGIAKDEARKIGGNALKITEHLFPDIWSSCHRIKAKILKMENVNETVIRSVSPDAMHPDSARVEQPDSSKANGMSTKFQSVKNDWNLRLSLNAGWGFRTAKTDPGLSGSAKTYIEDLKSGHAYAVDADYFFSDYYGAGIRYNLFSSSNSAMATGLVNGVSVTGQLSDAITIFYIGPDFRMRFPSATQTNAFLLGLSIGYIGYNDDGRFGTNKATINGSSVGLVYDLGYDMGLSRHTALGIDMAYSIGTLSSYDYTQGNTVQHVQLDKDRYEGLSHFDITLGFRLR